MYDYSVEKPRIFTDEGQRVFLKVRDHVRECLDKSGAVSMGNAMIGAGGGDSWLMMAYVDRMVEIGELLELTRGDVPGQDRVFVGTRR